MFGRVASSLLQGRPQAANGIDQEVEVLLSRATDGVLPHDRAEALAMLSELVRDNDEALKLIGLTGLSALHTILKEDRGEKDVLRGALECLNNALAAPQDGNRQSAVAMNAELLFREDGSIKSIFAILADEKDFYTRYHAVRLLTALSTSSTQRLAQEALKQPAAVTQLMDLLGDKHEVIRNEALLMMVGLTRASPDIRRFAAYEGAFENQIDIIRNEGGMSGSIVVQDCLDLMNTLLRDNPGNQLLLRESQSLTHFVGFASMSDTFYSRSQPRQRVANVLCLLDTLIVLTQQTGSAMGTEEARKQRLGNCAALLGLNLLDSLLMLAFKGTESSLQPVRTKALWCIANLIAGFKAGQERMVKSGLGWLQGTPSLRQVLRVCLHSREADEVAAAQAVLQAFCTHNPEGQSMLASTLLPAPNQDPGNTSFGGQLIKALKQQNAVMRSRAAVVLAYMLDDNAAVKEHLLQIPLGLGTGNHDSLLSRTFQILSEVASNVSDSESQAAVPLLRLLLAWLTDCPNAVQAFCQLDGSLHLLDSLSQARIGNGQVRGLAALLLGCCLVVEKENSGSAVVLDWVTTRSGVAAFSHSLEQLFEDEEFQRAAAGPAFPEPTARSGPTNHISHAQPGDRDGQAGAHSPPILDHRFTLWAHSMREKIDQHLASSELAGVPMGGGRVASNKSWQQPTTLEDAILIIHQLERELETLSSRNQALTQQATDLKRPRASTSRQDVSLPISRHAGSADLEGQDALRQQTLKLEATERRLFLAEEEILRLKSENSKLKDQRAVLEEQQQEVRRGSEANDASLTALRAQLKDAERDRDEAAAAASKFESELQAISEAYGDLETHAHSLESSLQTQGPTGVASEEDSTLDDLLACLGEEEQKVEKLSSKLQQLGFDAEQILADLEEVKSS